MSTTSAQTWIPFRWPSVWKTERELSLLEGTPINCVLEAPKEVAGAVKARGLASITKDEAAVSVNFLADSVWPSVKMARRGEGADSGPTGAPWVDANSWSIQLARATTPDKPVWVDATPPADKVLNDGAYVLAVAEPAMFGARWTVSLDDGFASKLASADAAAAKRWATMMHAVRFFEDRRTWNALDICSMLGVISDYTGDNEFMSHEILNLASRQGLSYRVYLKNTAARADFSQLKALLYVDEQAPSAELAGVLDRFARAGGMVIARKIAPFTGWTGQPAPSPIPGYEVKTVGKGKVAVPSAEWEDPWIVAQETRMLMGRRTETVRLYNAGITAANYTRSKDGATAVLHLLNYTMRPPAQAIAVAPAHKYASAKAVSPDQPQPKPLTIIPRSEGFDEIAVPSFNIYTAIELGR
jgi:hypothetical protein